MVSVSIDLSTRFTNWAAGLFPPRIFFLVISYNSQKARPHRYQENQMHQLPLLSVTNYVHYTPKTPLHRTCGNSLHKNQVIDWHSQSSVEQVVHSLELILQHLST